MSGKIGVILQARMSSSRFPGKTLQNIGEEPLIFHVVERLKLLDLPVIVATSIHPSDDKLCHFLSSKNILFFRGSLYNVLQRYMLAAEEFGIDRIIRITADNPLVDIDYLTENLSLFNQFDYLDAIYPGGFIKGVGFEMVRLSELKSIRSSQQQHLEHVTLWLREHLQESSRRKQLIPNNTNMFKEDIILTCDYPEDLLLLQEIYRHFNYRSNITIPEIILFLENNPSLKSINMKLHQ